MSRNRGCVVLIGGTGFLGSHFIRQYSSAFSKIVAMDLRPNTKLISDIISEKPDVIEILRGDAAELSDV
ncbi:MAG: hypothetical protein QXQ57_04595, partial [Sulfolobales archaeon]